MSKHYTEGRRYEQRFDDFRDPVWHTHPLKMKPRPPGPLKRFVARQAWDSEAPDRGEMTNLSLPVAHVKYVQTFTKPCTSLMQCKPILQELKGTQMKTGIPDIKYNFLISTDGSVYEGRGWTYNPDRSDDLDPHSGTFKMIDIAYIGTFRDGKVPKKMREAQEDFADWAVRHYKLSCCHESRMLKPVDAVEEEEEEDSNEDDFRVMDGVDDSESLDDIKLTKKLRKKR